MLYLSKHSQALLALAVVLVSPRISAAQSSGALDASFGSGGKVTTDFVGGFPDLASSAAVQPDGKIVTAGHIIIIGNYDFALARYNSDGTLDESFGWGGKVTTGFAWGSLDVASSVALQPDGKIVVAGQVVINGDADFALARYNSDGTLDESFGWGGKVTTDFVAGSSDRASSVAVLLDGKILAAGFANINGGYDFALARYNSDGTLDVNFGNGGRVTTDFAGFDGQDFSFALAFSVAVQPDERIIAAGQAFILDGFDVALAAYNSDGALDPSFGWGGKVITDLASPYDQVRSVVVQPDGQIVVAGAALVTTDWSSSFDFALARYNSNGTLDDTFGNGGKVTTDFGGTIDAAYSVALQPDLKIVAAGQAFSTSGGADFALARYNSDGTLDTTFGNAGRVTTDFEDSSDAAISVVVQPDGKIVAAGQAWGSGGGDFALTRYYN